MTIALSIVACTRGDVSSVVPPVQARESAHSFIRVLPPVDDPTMGSLSSAAQHIAAGLQDSVIRMAIRRSLLESHASVPELDLQACDITASDSDKLLQSGERRGAKVARDLCKMFKGMNGAILYMDPTQLAHWDGSTIPIVTAVADPDQPLPASIRGYRSPNVMIDMPTDGSMAGPMLAVLPLQHESQRSLRATAPSTRAVFVSNPKPDSL
jgi:hypothetical protein